MSAVPLTPATARAADAVSDDPVDEEPDWVRVLTVAGPERDAALRRLHTLMVRAAHHQVRRMRSMIPGADTRTCDDLANGAADDALTALLGKLTTFEGRSRFTTWAYKFAILQAATEVRRHAWSGVEVTLDEVGTWHDRAPGPDLWAESVDLARAVRSALGTALTPYQRTIAVAILVDQVPIDVLADRLGTTRGALYKTLHMARRRLRAELAATGHLLPVRLSEGADA